MKDLFDLKIDTILSFGKTVNSELIKEIELPPFSCHVMATKNTWDLNKKDYVEVEELFYYDNGKFYYTQPYHFNNTDWISKWRFPKFEER